MAAKKRKRSSLKRIRQTARREARAGAVRSGLRTLVKTARTRTGEPAAEAVRVAQAALDRAVAKGIIHRNTAARRASRMMEAVAKKQ